VIGHQGHVNHHQEADRLWILDPVFPVLLLDVLLQGHAALLVTGHGKQDCTKLGQARRAQW
jgi:hypothetical protein